MSLRTLIIIVLPYWAYVTASNILYAHGMGSGIATLTSAHLFAPPVERVLQHLMLLPALIACYYGSLRLGWSPWWRTWVPQLLLAVVFAALAQPLLGVAEHLLEPARMMEPAGDQPTVGDRLGTGGLLIWLASATSFVVTYGFGLALLTGFSFYRRSRDSELQVAELEHTVSATRLAALRMQLSPHTLFNLLHTIRGQISFDPRAAQAMVVQLADLLRRLLVAGERDLTLLADELQLVRGYLELQQRRFADRLRVSLPDPATVPDVWVPSLILYPVAENAIVHGLAGHDGEVQVHIDVLAGADTLTLRVRNTRPRDRDSGPEGIGLRNLRERLAVQFGGRASLSAGPEDGDGWLAEIRIPSLPHRS